MGSWRCKLSLTRLFFYALCSVLNKGRYLRRGKRPFAGSVLFPLLNLSRRNPQGEDGTPHLFSKPFPGIYLFALQIDKCHSNFDFAVKHYQCKL